jgi:predicted RNA binding protein YcfA (HicA-like mRNA interferase family)
MTKLLRDAISQVEQLPEGEQDAAATAMLDYLTHRNDLRVSDKDLAEIRRRLDDPNRKLVSHEEARARQASGRVKVREAIRLIEDDGWYLVATRGSHRQYKHPTKPGRVTIAGKPSDDLAPGTRNSILKQAGLKEQR